MTAPQSRSIETIRLIGGRRCLDFVNTAVFSDPAEGTGDDEVFWEFLDSFADLLVWAGRVGVIDEAAAAELAERAIRQPAAAERAIKAARELRRQMRALLLPANGLANAAKSADDGTNVADRQIEHATRLLNSLRQSIAKAEIEIIRDAAPANRPNASGGPMALRLRAEAASASLGDWLFAPIALSAIELLTSADRTQVRQCPGDNCHWLFLDTSRNGTRRWCSMASCGNRAKAQRHYAGKRLAENPPRGHTGKASR